MEQEAFLEEEMDVYPKKKSKMTCGAVTV